MEKPALTWLETVYMEDLIRDIDRASICDETESSTKRKFPIELQAEILHPSVIILVKLVHVVIRIGGAAMKRQRGRYGYIREKSLVDTLPINSRIKGGGMFGIVDRDWREDSAGIFPNTAKFWVDSLFHLPPSLGFHPSGIIDVGGGRGLDGRDHPSKEHILLIIGIGMNILLLFTGIGMNTLLLLTEIGMNTLLVIVIEIVET